MRQRPNRLRAAVVGLLTALILNGMFIDPPTARAQFGGTVWIAGDSSTVSLGQLRELTQQTIQNIKMVHTQDLTRLEMLAEYVKQGNRWLETVRHFAQVVEQNIRRFTTLKGIMGFAEQQLGLDEDTLKAFATLNEIARGIVSIKNQFESLCTTRIRMWRNMWSRAKAGIFNPSADLADLEDYLTNSIGRSSAEVIATRERLAQFDNELEAWTHQLELARARQAALIQQRDKAHEFLQKEGALETRPRTVAQDAEGAAVNTNPTGGRVSASAEAIKEAQDTMRWCDSELAKVTNEITDLIAKIEERYKKYHMKFDQSKHTAENVEKNNRAWDDFMSIKNEAALEMIEGFKGDTPPRLRPPRPRRTPTP